MTEYGLNNKHYFLLILSTRTYESHYEHGGYADIEDIKAHLNADEILISAWEVGDKVY